MKAESTIRRELCKLRRIYDDRTRCRHCGSVAAATCDLCGEILDLEQCATCHNELVHDIVRMQNIHICGNRARGSDPDNDPDAFGRSDL